MHQKTILSLVFILAAVLAFVIGGCCMVDRQETSMKGVGIVKLKEWQLPDPNLVKGILIYFSYQHYRPSDNSPALEPNETDLSLLIGDRAELEGLMGHELNVPMAVNNSDAGRTISGLYAQALTEVPASWLLLTQERIVFVTDKAAYVRGFSADYGKVVEKYMKSGAIWREFRKIGCLEETEPDHSAPSYIPPIPENQAQVSRSLAERGVKIVTCGPYDLPPEEVRAILIYGESNLNAQRGLEDRSLCLAVGAPKQLEKLVGANLKPRLMVPDPNEVATICQLYSETLAEWAKETARLKTAPRKTMYGTAWTIVFVTDKAAYIRGFGVRPRQQCIYDEWMESLSPDLWQEFVEIGYLKKSGQ
jgi:hypothetical protein